MLYKATIHKVPRGALTQEAHCAILVTFPLIFPDRSRSLLEDEKFKEALRITLQHFKRVTIIIFDTLERWTRAIISDEKPPVEFFEQCQEEGLGWLERNCKTDSSIAKFKILGEELNDSLSNEPDAKEIAVIRWDSWISTSKNKAEFTSKLKFVKDMYYTNPAFTHSVDSTISRFNKSHKKAFKGVDPERRIRYSMEYIFEKSAVFLQCAKYNIDFILSPSNVESALGYVLKHEANKNLDAKKILQPLTISFEPIKNAETLPSPHATIEMRPCPASKDLINRAAIANDMLIGYIDVVLGAACNDVSPEEQIRLQLLVLNKLVKDALQRQIKLLCASTSNNTDIPHDIATTTSTAVKSEIPTASGETTTATLTA